MKKIMFVLLAIILLFAGCAEKKNELLIEAPENIRLKDEYCGCFTVEEEGYITKYFQTIIVVYNTIMEKTDDDGYVNNDAVNEIIRIVGGYSSTVIGFYNVREDDIQKGYIIQDLTSPYYDFLDYLINDAQYSMAINSETFEMGDTLVHMDSDALQGIKTKIEENLEKYFEEG